MDNEWAWWQAALAGKQQDIYADAPQSGFYKMRTGKGGPWVAVMIRMHDGQLAARVGNERRDPVEIWTYVAGNPVTREAASHWFKTGEWPGDAPALSNSANATPLELLRDYIETASEWFKGKTIDTQTLCDQAANYAAELIRLKGVADKERDAKVRPHLDAQREINGEYKPQLDAADMLAKTIKRATDTFLIAEKRRLEAEARAKWEAEQKAAAEERARIEAERAAKMQADPIAALTDPEPELPIAPAAPAPVKVNAGGQRGKKLALKTYRVPEIVDYAAALAWAKEHPEVVAAVEKVCKAAARDGEKVPGVEVRIEERAA